MSELVKTRAINLILVSSVGLSALMGVGATGCEKQNPNPTPSPSISPYGKCVELSTVTRVEGGFLVDSCSIALYDPKDPYNHRVNPKGLTSDELILDISPGETFGVTCLQLENKPTQAIIPTYNSLTAAPILGAVNLTRESSELLQQEDIPNCTPDMFNWPN